MYPLPISNKQASLNPSHPATEACTKNKEIAPFIRSDRVRKRMCIHVRVCECRTRIKRTRRQFVNMLKERG